MKLCQEFLFAGMIKFNLYDANLQIVSILQWEKKVVLTILTCQINDTNSLFIQIYVILYPLHDLPLRMSLIR